MGERWLNAQCHEKHLLGQDQFVVTSDSEPVIVALMADHNFFRATKQEFGRNGRRHGGPVFNARGRNGSTNGIGFHICLNGAMKLGSH